ncbi:MAG: M81 family metallopeptidase, partial [Gemmatimonadetes bacterium]|nr:M81 family metallopeptidase [Gemmatimonadota bacterium]
MTPGKCMNERGRVRPGQRAVSLTAIATALLACGSPPGNDRGDLRFAVASYQHETCTFCPGGDTEVDDWLRYSEPVSGEALLSSGGYIGGFVQQAREFGDVELVPLTSPVGVFGGSSRSWNTRETFEHFLDAMLAELEEQLPVDGVFLALHGAMAVRDIPRPEAEIARRFREVVGPDVPIAATFDLHGNEDGEFLEHADFSLVTKRFPHYDSYIQGERAARALRLTARDEYEPATATRKPGIITATVLQWTGQSPAMDIMERARRWEAREHDAYVSVFFGYPWSDVPDVGATIQVMTNGDQALADRIADDMDDFFWRVREDFALGSFPRPTEASQIVAAAISRGQTPVAVGDYSDRPGDATHILRAFEAAGIGNVLYGTITSPATLDALPEAAAQPGAPVGAAIGGVTPAG